MNLKEMRKKMNLTQTELAEKCGVSTRTYQMWEQSGDIPSRNEKLLISIYNEYEKNSSEETSKSSQKEISTEDIEKFLSVLSNQQDIMCKQLEELIELRKMTQKKDEQIDILLNMVYKKNE